jgi:hypothetical protein
MLRELTAIHTTGRHTDPIEWHTANALWFHAREKVITALKTRELVTDLHGDLALTNKGRAALGIPAKHGGTRTGAGRKSLDPQGTVVTTVRLTATQRATLDMLGGAAWLRQHLDNVSCSKVSFE